MATPTRYPCRDGITTPTAKVAASLHQWEGGLQWRRRAYPHQAGYQGVKVQDEGQATTWTLETWPLLHGQGRCRRKLRKNRTRVGRRSSRKSTDLQCHLACTYGSISGTRVSQHYTSCVLESGTRDTGIRLVEGRIGTGVFGCSLVKPGCT